MYVGRILFLTPKIEVSQASTMGRGMQGIYPPAPGEQTDRTRPCDAGELRNPAQDDTVASVERPSQHVELTCIVQAQAVDQVGQRCSRRIELKLKNIARRQIDMEQATALRAPWNSANTCLPTSAATSDTR